MRQVIFITCCLNGVNSQGALAADMQFRPAMWEFPATLTVAGEIVADDLKKFRGTASMMQEIGETDFVLVLFSEMKGGDLATAIRLGQEIRRRKFTTSVTDDTCTAACSLAWIGGIRRYLVTGGTIQFHFESEGVEPVGRTLSEVEPMLKEYLSELQVPRNTVKFMLSPSKNDRHPLDFVQIRSRGIEVRTFEPIEIPASR